MIYLWQLKKKSPKQFIVKEPSPFDEPVSDLVDETKKSKRLLVVIIGVLILAGAAGGFFYIHHKIDERTDGSSGQMLASQIVTSVSKLMELPTNEMPTIATVTDLAPLKSQPFFAKAKLGDKVLIYQQNKEAILYDPQENKIVNVGPINLGSQSTTAIQQPTTAQTNITPTPTPQVLVKVALFNGTTTEGFASKIETQLQGEDKAVTVVSKGNAVKNDYSKTIVIDLSKTNSKEAKQLASELGGSVGELPAGEQAPAGADILVILGNNH